MILKEVTIGVKLTREFDSHTVTKTYELSPEDKDPTQLLLPLIEKEVETYLQERKLLKGMK